MTVVSVVCCQVEVSVTGRSLIQRSPTECGESIQCDRKEGTSPQGLSKHEKKNSGEYYQGQLWP